MILRKAKNKKRGFTLAETVFALAIIAVVSVSSLTLILSAQKSTFAALEKQQAQLYAADIISCYRVSDSKEDFKSNVEFALGDGAAWSSETELTMSGDKTALIKEEEVAGRRKLTVTIFNGEKELTELSFTKGEVTP